MAHEDEGLDTVEEPDDPDLVDLDALDEDDDDLIEDDPIDVLDPDVDADVLDPDVDAEVDVMVDPTEVVDDAAVSLPAVAAPAGSDDEEEEEDEEDIDPDDVEAGLDVILKDRLVVADEEEDEEDDVPDAEDRAEGSIKVLPKRPGEFVCQSCFLVKHPSQLADPDRMFCRDCV